MELSTIALRGLDAALAGFDQAASRIVRATAPSDPASADAVNWSAAVVGLLTARQDFAANLKVLKVAGEMERHTLDILA